MENLLKNLFNNIENNENVLDLSNKQDLEKFHQYIDELKGNKIFTAFAKYFGCNLDESFNALHQFADDYYADCQKEQKDKTKYQITFDLEKSGEVWELRNLNEIDRQKIHGLY